MLLFLGLMPHFYFFCSYLGFHLDSFDIYIALFFFIMCTLSVYFSYFFTRVRCSRWVAVPCVWFFLQLFSSLFCVCCWFFERAGISIVWVHHKHARAFAFLLNYCPVFFIFCFLWSFVFMSLFTSLIRIAPVLWVLFCVCVFSTGFSLSRWNSKLRIRSQRSGVFPLRHFLKLVRFRYFFLWSSLSFLTSLNFLYQLFNRSLRPCSSLRISFLSFYWFQRLFGSLGRDHYDMHLLTYRFFETNQIICRQLKIVQRESVSPFQTHILLIRRLNFVPDPPRLMILRIYQWLQCIVLLNFPFLLSIFTHLF